MKRKQSLVCGLLAVALALVVAGGVFAQEEGAPARNISNWISGEVSLLGAGARYERMLNDKLSIGANVYWSSFFIIWNELEIGVSARYYPWGKTFFAGLGLGFHQHSGLYEYEDEGSNYSYTYTWFGTVTGVAITPEAGWRIDVGNTGGFFISPGIKLPITLGKLEDYEADGLVGDLKASGGGFRVGFGIVPYFGLGYAF